jgi:hypothetical protein
MSPLRGIAASVLCTTLWIAPVWGAPPSALGIIVSADHARLGGASSLTSGTTVFGGDKLTTEETGSVQVRVGAARLVLSKSTIATIGQEQGSPSATLASGTAVFSTANSKDFALRVATAVIRPLNDEATVGQVTVLGPKELTVRSTRGSLTITVEDDSRVIPEGAAYRVVLDPSERALNAEAQEPQGVGSRQRGGPPIMAGRSKFVWFAIGVTAIVTAWALHHALVSPDRL